MHCRGAGGSGATGRRCEGRGRCGGGGRDPTLHFRGELALEPPEVKLDMEQQAQAEKELADAVNAPLPDDDDDGLLE